MGVHSYDLLVESRHHARVGPALPDLKGPAEPAADGEALLCMAVAFGRMIGADGIIVGLHRDHERPALILSTGICEGADTASRMLRAVARSVGIAPAWERLTWGSLGGHEPGELVLSARIAAGDERLTLSAVFHHLDADARTQVEEAATNALPLVEPFLRLWSSRLALARHTDALTAAIDRTELGLILVDGNGAITFANAQARRMLDEGDGVRCCSGRLSASSLQDTLRLQAMVDYAMDARDCASEPSSTPVLAIKRGSRRPLIASAAGLSAAQRSQADGTAVVHLIDPEQDLEPSLAPACGTYGLSPVESRLTCLLADGKPLAAAAKIMKIRELTARGYLKQIFLKTETSRQAELVWLMLKSAVRTTPELRATK